MKYSIEKFKSKSALKNSVGCGKRNCKEIQEFGKDKLKYRPTTLRKRAWVETDGGNSTGVRINITLTLGTFPSRELEFE